MTKRSYTRRVPAIACPHCRQPTITRSSEQITDLVRELRVHCDNDACGAQFSVQLSFIREIRGSECPNPRVRLPFGGSSRKPANDDAPLPANDDRPAAAAAPAAPMTG